MQDHTWQGFCNSFCQNNRNEKLYFKCLICFKLTKPTLEMDLQTHHIWLVSNCNAYDQECDIREQPKLFEQLLTTNNKN